MGRPKQGVLMPDGRTMIAHVIQPLSQLCQNIVTVGDCVEFTMPPQKQIIALPDDPPGRGPLSAIATLLKSGIDKEGYIVTACDQPFLTPNLLALLVGERTTTPRIFQEDMDTMAGVITPFPGYYPVCWLSIIERELASGQYGVCNAILKSAVKTVSLNKDSRALIRNINTPDDLNEFKLHYQP
jgi:molybdopterin-guanine dinucleotide biosynthesis protein A